MKAIITGLFLFGSCILQAQTKESLTIYFDFNKYNLNDGARMKLDSFLHTEKPASSKEKIELHGHCDFIGSDNYNDALSQRRVNTVKNYLLGHRIKKETLVLVKAHGKREPLNDNKTAAERQLNRRVEINIISEADISLKERIADSSATAGTNIVLKNINFEGGRHQVLPESVPMLEELVAAMNAYPRLVIEIQGHVCCVADKGDGTDLETGLNNLSEARAKAIRDYLIAHGIEPRRLSYKGFGHSVPLYPYPEQTEEEKTGNRRVEIKIISK